MLRKYLGDKYRFLQAAIDGMADPIIVVGTDFRVNLMNRAARDYSRCGDRPIDDLPRCHQLIFGLAETCDHVGRPCPLLMVREQGAQVRVEHEYPAGDGLVRTFEISASPLLSEEGELLGMVESMRDVTERKEAAELLRSDQERLEERVRRRTAELVQAKEQAELLYRVSPSAIFTVDQKGRVTSWNDKAREITGYREREMLGQSCHLVMAGEDASTACCQFVSAADGRVQGQERLIRTKAGEHRVARFNSAALRDDRGEIIGCIGSFEDITEQKRIEEVMRTERDKFRGMLAALGQGMHILNRNFEIEYQNEVLRTQFGDKLGEKCYRVYKGREVPCEVCRMHAAIESGAIQRTEELMANGRFYEQSYAPFMDVDGQTKALILLRDITEEKALQAETMRAGQLASIGELAAGVAHEINNPINGIINYAQVLLDESTQIHLDLTGERLAQGQVRQGATQPVESGERRLHGGELLFEGRAVRVQFHRNEGASNGGVLRNGVSVGRKAGLRNRGLQLLGLSGGWRCERGKRRDLPPFDAVERNAEHFEPRRHWHVGVGRFRDRAACRHLGARARSAVRIVRSQLEPVRPRLAGFERTSAVHRRLDRRKGGCALRDRRGRIRAR